MPQNKGMLELKWMHFFTEEISVPQSLLGFSN
ncbi:hypothetical protein X953_18730 [Virgibacillus sp. SK37]|nr:hypothetical protein X953_18730 [Virgibacillus sp. SK37]